jgi:hypothetical protein
MKGGAMSKDFISVHSALRSTKFKAATALTRLNLLINSLQMSDERLGRWMEKYFHLGFEFHKFSGSSRTGPPTETNKTRIELWSVELRAELDSSHGRAR